MVRLLWAAVRYGRNQQQLLSPAQGRNLRYVARAGARRFLLCRQGEPLHHAGEEAQGLPGAARAHDRADAASAIRAGSDPLSATAVVAPEPRPARGLPEAVDRTSTRLNSSP